MPTHEVQTYRRLYHIAHALHEQAGSTHGVLETTLRLTEQALNVERGCIITVAADGAFKNAWLSDGQDDSDDSDLWQRLSELVRNGQRTVTLDDLSVGGPWTRGEGRQRSPLTGSAVAVALMHETRLLGILMLYHLMPQFFDADNTRLIEMIAGVAAAALANAERLEMLADSQALYRSLYRDSVFATVITNLNGAIVDANPKACTLFGYDRQVLAGQPLASVIHIGRDPLSAGKIEAAAWVEALELSATAQTAGGPSLPVRLFARRVHLDTGDYLVWVAQDASGQAEKEAYRRDLEAMIYHDLRGPLNNINLGLTRIDTLLPDRSPEVSELLRMAIGSTRQLTRMLNSLLDLEQLERGRAELDRQPAAPVNLVTQAIEATNMLSEDAGHQLTLRVDVDLPNVDVDVDMMVRVIVNLLENAIKYTPDGGHIVAQASDFGDHIRIAVSDSGPGIPNDLREQIFDKYVRIREQRSRSGHGLGLAFCRLAVEAHGGRIWVEDNPPQGARFIFTLPVAGS